MGVQLQNPESCLPDWTTDSAAVSQSVIDIESDFFSKNCIFMWQYRSGHNGADSKSCFLGTKIAYSYTERYRSGHNGTDSKSCYLCLKLNNYTVETYRSGHNEPDSKSGSPQGLVGSNPTVSATKALKTLRFQGFFLTSCGTLFRWIF